MAAEFGCDEEELALTRGASESLQIVQNGIDLEAGRRGAYDGAGLSADADDVGSARAARQNQGDPAAVFGARHAGSALPALRKRDHASNEGLPLLPHHESHGTAVSGPTARRSWRGPAASSRSSMEVTRWAISRSRCAISNAMPTEPACTSGCSLLSAMAVYTCGVT